MVTHLRLQLVRNDVIQKVSGILKHLPSVGIVGTGDHFMVLSIPTGGLVPAVRTLLDHTSGVVFTTTEGEHAN